MNQYEFKVGDPVFLVYYGLGGKTYEALTKVESISPKRGDVKIEGFKVIFYTNGREKKSSGYSRSTHIELATDELKAEVKALQKRRKDLLTVQNIDAKEMTEEGIAALATAIRGLPQGSFKPKTESQK